MAQRRENDIGYQAESRHGSVKDTQMYKRILGQGLSGVGMRADGAVPSPVTASTVHPGQSLHHVPPRSSGEGPVHLGAPTPATLRDATVAIPGLSHEQNARIVRGVVEVAAAAATAAVQDAQRQHEHQHGVVRKLSAVAAEQNPRTHIAPGGVTLQTDAPTIGPTEELGAHGGHDAPNWSKVKSAVILLGSTILYAVIAGESIKLQSVDN